jgi:galactokinase
MRAIEQQALDRYRDRFGAEPELVASAPGRVNLIGEHTDYSGGFVLPCAIDRRIAVALGRGDGGFASTAFPETRSFAGKDDSWADYPRGVAWALADAGFTIPTFQAAFAGDVPQAAGLSSSAAIESATALALDQLLQLRIPRRRLALLGQRAENAFVGVNCGIMDQYASLLCQAGSALLIDCRSLDAEVIPLELDRHGLTLLVGDSRVKRGLGATAYNERRASCEAAAGTLGVPQLRDASLDDLAKLSGVTFQRARHVVTENARVLAAVAALRSDDFATFGRLMDESHASLRDDFAVSVPELDTFVDVADQAGALGSRLTGAGFGGCAIALVPSALVESVSSAVSTAYRERGFVEPVFYVFRPSPGAELAGTGQ